MQNSPFVEGAENSYQVLNLNSFPDIGRVKKQPPVLLFLRSLKILKINYFFMLNTPKYQASTPKNQPRREFKPKKPNPKNTDYITIVELPATVMKS